MSVDYVYFVTYAAFCHPIGHFIIYFNTCNLLIVFLDDNIHVQYYQHYFSANWLSKRVSTTAMVKLYFEAFITLSVIKYFLRFY